MKLRILFLLLGLCLINFTSFSSHISGGDLTYRCLGGNQYEITVKLFRDCQGIGAPNTVTVNFDNTCGFNNPAGLVLNPVLNPSTGTAETDISQVCPLNIAQTTCNGGNIPGMQLYVYQAIVTLPAACNSWRFYYTTCCRNAAVVNVGANGTYLGATVNNAAAPCNSSPIYTSHPVPYVCVNQVVNYNFGVVEADGDSLAYQFISAQQNNPPVALTYTPPYTANSPLVGITLDQTGQLTFTPTATGSFVVVVQVTEYDAAGNIIGTTFRDIQFVVRNCTNQAVDPSPISIVNHTGSGTLTAQRELEVCIGDQFCFDLAIQDPDAGDSVFVTSNIATVLPGATVTYTGLNPVTAQVCWTVQPGSNSFNVVNFDVRDDACPIVGQANFSVVVKVISSTYAGPDETICLGDSIQLSATGGVIFTWTAITGPAIAVGTNFSCNPCANPIAFPNTTTSYEVSSDLTGGCHNIDTVTITVAPNFTYTISQSANSSCKFEDISFDIVPTPTGAYTYLWDPATMLDNANIANPVLTPSASGSFTYTATITSALGCVKIDSLSIFISQGIKPGVNATTDVDTIRCNETANLTANVDSSIAIIDFTDDFEGPAPNSIWSNTNSVTIGSACGTNNLSAGALIFDGGTGDRTATTVPFQANICSTIDFCLKPAGNAGTCNAPETSDNILLEYSVNGGASWIGLRVYSVTMWAFPTTNAVFQCYSIPMPVSTGSVMFRFNQPFNNYLGAAFDYWILDDVSITCSSLSNYTYDWTPTTNLATPNTNATTATPAVTTTYQVIVTDTSGGCADTSSLEIAVKNDYPDVQFSSDIWDGCYPVKVNFSNDTDPTKVGTVLWDFGNGQTSVINPTVEVDYTVPGIYPVYLRVTSPFGCVADTTIDSMIHVYDYPLANFSATPQPTNTSNTFINFQDLSSLDVITWNWFFGINDPSFIDSSSLQNPSNKYPDLVGDNYYVTLAVENSDGCTDTIIREVIINDLYTMYMPNSFTPNADGVNDTFKPSGEQISTTGYEFRVFNRWGELVFFTIDPDESWNGEEENVVADGGTYTWTVRSVDDNNGDKYFYKGHVLLIK